MGSVSVKKKKNKLKNFVSWFEIPAYNLDQAVAFYNHIYGIEMEIVATNEYRIAFFPAAGGIGGAIVSGPTSVPNDTGPLIFLNAGNDLNDILKKIPEAGGRIVMPKTLISDDAGYFAIFIDSEGNKLALHSGN
jgi:uncharacterized protein